MSLWNGSNIKLKLHKLILNIPFSLNLARRLHESSQYSKISETKFCLFARLCGSCNINLVEIRKFRSETNLLLVAELFLWTSFAWLASGSCCSPSHFRVVGSRFVVFYLLDELDARLSTVFYEISSTKLICCSFIKLFYRTCGSRASQFITNNLYYSKEID